MPAFNAGKYISDAIKSVQKQTHTIWELIIIDDGSTDETKELVKHFQKNDNRIIYFYQKNKRLGAARNCGLKNAKGNYIAFLDSDDLWLPNKLEFQLEVFESNAVDIVYTDGFILNEVDQSLDPYLTISGSFSGLEMYKILFEHNYVPVLSVMMRKEWVNKVGFQLEKKEVFGCEDWDYWLRMAQAGANFQGMPEKLFYYRKHTNNMSNSKLSMRIAVATVYVKNVNKKLLDKYTIAHIHSDLINLFNELLKDNKIEEARYIAKILNNITPKLKYFIIYCLVSCFGSHSLRILNLIASLKPKVVINIY